MAGRTQKFVKNMWSQWGLFCGVTCGVVTILRTHNHLKYQDFSATFHSGVP